MTDKTKNLQNSWEKRSAEARKKALVAITDLKIAKEPVNFNSVHLRSGVSKHFLYKDETIRITIETAREKEAEVKKAWHRKYDKTSDSKDVIIKTKDKYIAKLEAENNRLRQEINQLRALIYEKK